MAFEWDRSLAVGVARIDEDHQELFRRVNALLEAFLAHAEPAELDRLLVVLAQCALDHFALEERLMRQHRYPDLAAHVDAHVEFVKRFGALKNTLDREGPSPAVTIEINRVLGLWLRDHLGRLDAALGKFLQQVEAPGTRA